MATIDGQEVLLTQSFIIGEEQRLNLTLPVRGEFIPVEIRFTTNTENPSAVLKFGIDDGGLPMKSGVYGLNFVNWRNSLGIATQKTLQIAIYENDSGKEEFFVSLLAVGYAIGKQYFVTLQFMTESLDKETIKKGSAE